ncbi:hypothetical protein PUL39_030470 [Pseudomonas aeruginosa]|nr:hypothetical protein [Pseudomonas aeruginosa]MDE8660770.1 hypothetical protein [Pseudomonas aeruginosa]
MARLPFAAARGTANDFGNTSALVGYAFRVVEVEMATFPDFRYLPGRRVVAGITLNISALFLNQDITLGLGQRLRSGLAAMRHTSPWPSFTLRTRQCASPTWSRTSTTASG